MGPFGDRLREAARDVVESLGGAPVRTGLAALATLLGGLTLSLLFALLVGVSRQNEEVALRMGVDVVAVVPDDPAPGEGLTLRHRRVVAAAFPSMRVSALKIVPGEPVALAVDPSFFLLKRWPLLEGRPFDRADVDHSASSGVISLHRAREEGLSVGSPVAGGGALRTVVGVVDTGPVRGGSTDVEGVGDVYLPLKGVADGEPIDMLFIGVGDPAGTGPMRRKIAQLLAQPDLLTGPLRVEDAASVAENVTRMGRQVNRGLAGVALLCLLLGGSALASQMLAGVAERVSEIGLRRSLGATRGDIALLFLMEGGGVGGLAGGAGVALALVLYATIDPPMGLPLSFGWEALVGPTLLTTAVGLLSAIPPAWVAGNIAPIDALRLE